MNELDSLLQDLITQDLLVDGVLSNPRSKQLPFKIGIRSLNIKQKRFYQFSEHFSDKVLHANLLPQQGISRILDALSSGYRQALLRSREADYHVLVNRQNKVTLLKKVPTKTSPEKESLSHNRSKKYLLEEGIPLPFLVELDVMTSQGKIKAQKQDKFRQMNRFLEMVRDILPYLDSTKTLEVIDFGCGKAYLTFALYHYLHDVLGYDVKIIGLDLKKEVIAFCQSVAEKLHYEQLRFELGDIGRYNANRKVDLVVSLHACDTATDAAIEKAISWQADVILAVPCCQHELYPLIQCEPLQTLLRHGILKERFASLVTDAIRAELLESQGYKTQILEFIDMEHTPKNLLIRAVRKALNEQLPLDRYKKIKELLGLDGYKYNLT